MKNVHTRRILTASLLAVTLGCASKETPESRPKALRSGEGPGALEQELAALGPSEKERLEAIAVDEAEKAEIKTKIAGFNYRRRQGSAVQIRRNRREELLQQHGILAVPFLVAGTADPAYWTQRTCAEALADLCGDANTAEDTRWLCFHLGAPEKLIAMYSNGGPVAEEIGLKQAVERALTGILDESHGDDPGQWKAAWSKARDQWKRDERKKLLRRAELEKELGKE